MTKVFINCQPGAGGMQKKKKGLFLRRSKFLFPTKDATIMIRSHTIEEAKILFIKYHGTLDEVNTRKIRKETVKRDYAEGDHSEHARTRNSALKEMEKE